MVKHSQQFVGKLPTNCLSVFDYFLGLALKGLIQQYAKVKINFGLFELQQILIRNGQSFEWRHRNSFMRDIEKVSHIS